MDLNIEILTSKNPKDILNFINSLDYEYFENESDFNYKLFLEITSNKIYILKKQSDYINRLYWLLIAIKLNGLLSEFSKTQFNTIEYEVMQMKYIIIGIKDYYKEAIFLYKQKDVLNWFIVRIIKNYKFKEIEKLSSNWRQMNINKIRELRMIKMCIQVIKFLQTNTESDIPILYVKWLSLLPYLP